MKRLIYIFFALFIIVSTSCNKDNKTEVIPTKANEFNLKNLEDQSVSLTKYKNKIILLSFWSAHCIPCLAEIKSFNKLIDDFDSTSFQIISINIDNQEQRKISLAVAKKFNIKYPVLLGTNKVIKKYGGINKLPTCFLIRKDGIIDKKFVGLTSYYDFKNKIKDLQNKK